MSRETFTRVVQELCSVIGLPDHDHVLKTRAIQVEGFDVKVDYFDNDLGALYVIFQYGAVTAGRTLVVWRLMLEANLLVYAQDQAQLGMDSDTGGIVLMVRLPFSDSISGAMIADVLTHYAEHGRYWRTTIVESSDAMFEGIASGNYLWLRG